MKIAINGLGVLVLIIMLLTVFQFLTCNKEDEADNKPDLEFVLVEGGTFQMGAPDSIGTPDEHPQHQVTLSSFKISKYEVTANQYMQFMLYNENPDEKMDTSKGYVFEHKWALEYKKNRWQVVKGKDNFPVINVTDEGASAFCRYYGWRLPTEAEWEFAARGGNLSEGYLFSGSNNLNEVGCYNVNSGDSTHEVGRKKPNELGLYDMSGNTSEWCGDGFAAYASDPQINPHYPTPCCESNIMRGGQWDTGSTECRNTYRILLPENKTPTSYYTFGFRCAADVK